jgi:mRNA interferase RelE/StbE
MNYGLEIRPNAEKAMARLDAKLRARIDQKILSLGADPRPVGSVKLSGYAILWRVRVGDYRIVYEIHEDRRVVIIVIVAHRRESYRGL